MFAPPKPWKQPKSVPASCRPQAPRRNPGRHHAQTWKSGQVVCGNALVAVEDDGESDAAWRMDVEREWRREEYEWAAEEDAWGHERTEVQLMDIAKPMKPKGSWFGDLLDFR